MKIQKPQPLKTKDGIFSILQLIVFYFYKYIKAYYIPAAITILILIIVTGKSLAEDGLLLTIIILSFVFLHFLVKWLEKE
jgi:hypothetical protein